MFYEIWCSGFSDNKILREASFRMFMIWCVYGHTAIKLTSHSPDIENKTLTVEGATRQSGILLFQAVVPTVNIGGGV